MQVDAVVHGLPSGPFSTVEYDGVASSSPEGMGEGRLKLAHTWDWVDLLSIDADEEEPPSAVDAAAMAEDSDSCIMYVAEDRSYSVIPQGARRISGHRVR